MKFFLVSGLLIGAFSLSGMEKVRVLEYKPANVDVVSCSLIRHSNVEDFNPRVNILYTKASGQLSGYPVQHIQDKPIVLNLNSLYRVQKALEEKKSIFLELEEEDTVEYFMVIEVMSFNEHQAREAKQKEDQRIFEERLVFCRKCFLYPLAVCMTLRFIVLVSYDYDLFESVTQLFQR